MVKFLENNSEIFVIRKIESNFYHKLKSLYIIGNIYKAKNI